MGLAGTCWGGFWREVRSGSAQDYKTGIRVGQSFPDLGLRGGLRLAPRGTQRHPRG